VSETIGVMGVHEYLVWGSLAQSHCFPPMGQPQGFMSHNRALFILVADVHNSWVGRVVQ
jgi:hypothetical protein